MWNIALDGQVQGRGWKWQDKQQMSKEKLWKNLSKPGELFFKTTLILQKWKLFYMKTELWTESECLT